MPRVLGTKLKGVGATAFSSNVLRAKTGVCGFTRLFGNNKEEITRHTGEGTIGEEVLLQVKERTKLLDAKWQHMNSNITDVVNMGAGLDMRAWRVPMRDGVRVHEIDKRKVVKLKKQYLEKAGLDPHLAQDRVPILYYPVDLCHFKTYDRFLDDKAQPLWHLEGLLEYLPPRLQENLFSAMKYHTTTTSEMVTTMLLPSIFEEYPVTFQQQTQFGAWALPLPSLDAIKDVLRVRKWDITDIEPITSHSVVITATHTRRRRRK